MPRLRLAALAVAIGLAATCRAPGSELPPASDLLPGAVARSAAVEEDLREAVAAKGPDYRPRTRHLRPDGSARYTNRLILRPSPYLLQHAHNPVDWYPFGDEAFARARAERKPVLLSVGYSTCHWCHVMEEESFEDEEVARYLNTHYVAVKVDREEQPDVDETYMAAVQILTGGGGWPMTVWLTPERLPFFAGTYFPARDGDRGARVGFLTLLEQLRGSFDDDPEGVARRANEITAGIRRLAARAPGDALPPAGLLRTAVDEHRRRFDAHHGGFGGAPKFPLPAVLSFLLRYHRRSGDASVLAMVTRTLDGMAAGGIYDHVGGGFHRYATDAAWRVPHFEKMLYDNAQLALVYLEAFQVTDDPEHARVVRETLDYLGREMRAPGGGFHAASDADSEGEEGTFFVWTPAEIAATLDPAATSAVLTYHGVTEAGNFEGRNVLYRARTLAEVAAELGTEPERLRTLLADARARLSAARATRVAPHVDTKVLVAWNGLAISAFARAGAVLGEPAYVDRARAAADFILGSMRPDGSLQRSYAAGRAYQDAFLEDYAFLAVGLLDLYEATFETRWLEEAVRLHAVMAARFWDEEGGGFFMTAEGPGNALAREKPDYDGAVPSGNALAVEGLLRLAEITGDDRYRRRAARTLQALAGGITRSPAGATRLLAAYEFLLDQPREIVIVRAATGTGDGGDALLAAVHDAFVPNRMLAVAVEGADLARQQALIPLLAEKRALGGASTAYVCEQGVCELPTSDPAVLARQLAKVHPLPADGGGD